MLTSSDTTPWVLNSPVYNIHVKMNVSGDSYIKRQLHEVPVMFYRWRDRREALAKVPRKYTPL